MGQPGPIDGVSLPSVETSWEPWRLLLTVDVLQSHLSPQRPYCTAFLRSEAGAMKPVRVITVRELDGAD